MLVWVLWFRLNFIFFNVDWVVFIVEVTICKMVSTGMRSIMCLNTSKLKKKKVFSESKGSCQSCGKMMWNKIDLDKHETSKISQCDLQPSSQKANLPWVSVELIQAFWLLFILIQYVGVEGQKRKYLLNGEMFVPYSFVLSNKAKFLVDRFGMWNPRIRVDSMFWLFFKLREVI